MILLTVALSPALSDAAVAGKDLEGIKRRIETEKKSISRVQKREGSILQSLEKIEIELEKKNKELKQASSKLESTSRELVATTAEAANLSASYKRRQELFKRRVVALYRWHRGANPFVIFNGDLSWSGLLTRKRYLEATIDFDRDLIRRLGEEAQAQEALRAMLAEKKEELSAQRKALGEAGEAVRREAAKRKEILASLRREKETRLRALKELEQAALRLQKMLDEIARRAASKPQQAAPGTGLEAGRGKLDWPVKGEVTDLFGKSKHPQFAAEVFHNGIGIEAGLGDEVKSVEKGRVVYADRFAGYGKMVVVDHGERFFTIYAHLSEILKKSGEEVKRGEVLGLVGDSSSLAGVKLYFEMRKDGRSVDPMLWLRQP